MFTNLAILGAPHCRLSNWIVWIIIYTFDNITISIYI
jgi:hypothetical protein